MSHYFYECLSCKTQYVPNEIEPTYTYLCPECGETNQNMPLKGIFLIKFDYKELRKRYNQKFFLKIPTGKIWQYPHLWPLQIPPYEKDPPFLNITWENLFSLSLPCNKIHKTRIQNYNILIMNETNNPSYSYKDRASILVALKSIQLGIKEIAVASTGNAASSMACIGSKLHLTTHLWVPNNIPEAKLLQILAYGGQVHLVEGDYDSAFDLCLDISKVKGWYNRNTAYNPLTIEGKKSGAYDIFIEMKGNLPDYIFIPVGDGVIISGIYKGFWELIQLGIIEKSPKLIGIQSSGSNALVQYLGTGKFQYKSADTVADSISAGAPRNLYMAAHAIRESGGFAMSVEDSDIVDAQKIIGRDTGILVEPAAAASLAGFLKAAGSNEIDLNKQSLLLLTGSGLKDIDSLKRLYRIPDAFGKEIWKDRF
jgi:threonine synthase